MANRWQRHKDTLITELPISDKISHHNKFTETCNEQKHDNDIPINVVEE